ncbi:nitrate- and nitrite sensing domain-containing protein [Streptomyces sp. NPDC015127]|uniref:sensor histidine kinase n=1 Tax=Streptomyces sp. NPDC015127 TaxID=3364939 RepID=UPI0036F87A5D
MQKKRPRGKGGRPTGTAGELQVPAPVASLPQQGQGETVRTPAFPAPSTGPEQDDVTPSGRPARVRSRLVAAVAVVGLVVVGAGAPGVLATSAELTESQRLVTLAELDRQAVTLAHSLADERDEVTAYVAAGRDGAKDGGAEEGDGTGPDRPAPSATLSARVDRQIAEIRAAVPDDHADLRRALASLPGVRRTALTGNGTPLEVHRAYTAVVDRLQALADELAEKTPPRAAEATLPLSLRPGGAPISLRSPAALGHAVEQASATRGLLLAALSVPQPETRLTYDPVTGLPVQTEPGATESAAAAARVRNELTAAAQQARVRELAALAEFDRTAGKNARDDLAATVTGPEVKAAESYLARLTDQPRLTASERGTDRSELEAALTARIEQMRGAETALAADRLVRIEHLRDDDVTALEVRIALLGGLLVVTIGVLAAVSRTLTRPLAVLRIGAARLAESPETEEPVRFTGRNDEFAQVVRSLNSLHGTLRDLGARVQRLDGERGDLIGSRESLAAELAEVRTELGERAAELGTELERLRHTVHHTFVNLSLRTLGLVERQLGVIEKLEEREQDPERLATLFKLDHMATVMRRHSENLLVLAGAEHGQGHVGPVPLVDVLRAAVSEIERYDRVVIQSLPPHAQVAGFAADDLSHLVAELLENATSFSPPDAQVEMSGWLLESGEVMLSVQDAGIGMTEARIEEVNARLKNPETYETRAGRETEGLGLRVAALLAARHGVRIQLREHKQGGITAVVVVPAALLPDGPPATASQHAPVPGAAPTLTLPGSAAEANSNTLPASPRRPSAPDEGRPADPDDHAAPAADAADADTAPSVDGLADSDPFAADAADADPASRADVGADPETSAHAEPVASVDDAADADTAPAVDGLADSDPFAADAADADPASPADDPLLPPDPFVEAAERAVRAAEEERDAHERTLDGGVDEETFTMRLPQQQPSDDVTWDRVTDKGLPKRTPKTVAPPTAPAGRTGSVDAEALRRRLGGFHRAAQEGRRDAEAEIARSGAPQQDTDTETGDTVEEARS